MWFNVNWDAFMQSLLPYWWRRGRFVAFMRVLISPLVYLYNAFITFRERIVYDMTVTGQAMSLENALNDRFDAVDRGIYIENMQDLTQLYLYNKAEVRPPLFIYNKYNAAEVYTTGQFCTHNGSVYSSVTGSVGIEPTLASPEWSYERPGNYLINEGEALQPFDFIVWVPILLVFDPQELRALVNSYKLAGKRYTIMTY